MSSPQVVWVRVKPGTREALITRSVFIKHPAFEKKKKTVSAKAWIAEMNLERAKEDKGKRSMSRRRSGVVAEGQIERTC